MEVGLQIDVIVEHAWQAVLFKIGHAGNRIQTHLVRLEDGAKAVVVEVRDWIVLVIMALRAVQRQSEKGFPGVFDRIVQPCGTVEEVVVASKISGAGNRFGIVGRSSSPANISMTMRS